MDTIALPASDADLRSHLQHAHQLTDATLADADTARLVEMHDHEHALADEFELAHTHPRPTTTTDATRAALADARARHAHALAAQLADELAELIGDATGLAPARITVEVSDAGTDLGIRQVTADGGTHDRGQLPALDDVNEFDAPSAHEFCDVAGDGLHTLTVRTGPDATTRHRFVEALDAVLPGHWEAVGDPDGTVTCRHQGSGVWVTATADLRVDAGRGGNPFTQTHTAADAGDLPATAAMAVALLCDDLGIARMTLPDLDVDAEPGEVATAMLEPHRHRIVTEAAAALADAGQDHVAWDGVQVMFEAVDGILPIAYPNVSAAIADPEVRDTVDTALEQAMKADLRLADTVAALADRLGDDLWELTVHLPRDPDDGGEDGNDGGGGPGRAVALVADALQVPTHTIASAVFAAVADTGTPVHVQVTLTDGTDAYLYPDHPRAGVVFDHLAAVVDWDTPDDGYDDRGEWFLHTTDPVADRLGRLAATVAADPRFDRVHSFALDLRELDDDFEADHAVSVVCDPLGDFDAAEAAAVWEDLDALVWLDQDAFALHELAADRLLAGETLTVVVHPDVPVANRPPTGDPDTARPQDGPRVDDAGVGWDTLADLKAHLHLLHDYTGADYTGTDVVPDTDGTYGWATALHTHGGDHGDDWQAQAAFHTHGPDGTVRLGHVVTWAPTDPHGPDPAGFGALSLPDADTAHARAGQLQADHPDAQVEVVDATGVPVPPLQPGFSPGDLLDALDRHRPFQQARTRRQADTAPAAGRRLLDDPATLKASQRRRLAREVADLLGISRMKAYTLVDLGLPADRLDGRADEVAALLTRRR